MDENTFRARATHVDRTQAAIERFEARTCRDRTVATRRTPDHHSQQGSRPAAMGPLAWVALVVAPLLFGFGYLVQSTELDGLGGTLVGAGVLVFGLIALTLGLSADAYGQRDTQ